MAQQKRRQKGLEMVVTRNNFYRDHYYFTLFAVLLVLAINVFLGFMIFYKWQHPAEPQYFATSADGRIIKVHALDDPAVSDDFVVQFASETLQKSFSLDYMHWKAQLQEAQNNFTPDGWNYFTDALKKSNNLKTLVELKMVSNVEMTGAPEIVTKAVVGGHYAWNIQVPVLLTFTNGKKTIRTPINFTVIVLRESAQYYPQKIAINNIFYSSARASAYE